MPPTDVFWVCRRVLLSRYRLMKYWNFKMRQLPLKSFLYRKDPSKLHRQANCHGKISMHSTIIKFYCEFRAIKNFEIHFSLKCVGENKIVTTNSKSEKSHRMIKMYIEFAYVFPRILNCVGVKMHQVWKTWANSNWILNHYKQTQEKKSTLRCASLRGVEFFPHGKRGEGGGAAQGGFLLLGLFTSFSAKFYADFEF